MFFLSSIPLVRDWWPAEESNAAVTSLRHCTRKSTNLWECGYTAHCPHSILLLKCPVNHLLCEHHQTTSKKYNQHYSEQTCLMVKYDYTADHIYLQGAHVPFQCKTVLQLRYNKSFLSIVHMAKTHVTVCRYAALYLPPTLTCSEYTLLVCPCSVCRHEPSSGFHTFTR